MDDSSVVTQALEAISDLEDKIGKLLGDGIWNYGRVLAPKLFSENINIAVISPEAETLLKQYLNAANKIFEAFDLDLVTIPAESTKSPAQLLNEAFNQATYIIYTLRYGKALETLSDYCFLRTRTWLEQRIITASNQDQEADSEITYTIYLPGRVVLSERGYVDLKATAELEDKSDEIKTYLSVFPAADHYKGDLFFDMNDDSTYGMVPRLYEKQITEISKLLLMSLLYHPVHSIYDYLDRGYTATQAQNNTVQYVTNIIRQQNYQLAPAFADTEADIDAMLKTELGKLKQLEEPTRNTVAAELKNKALIRLAAGLIYPANYYLLDFRGPIDTNKGEEDYECLFDSYLYGAQELNKEFPFETYAMILTPQAKDDIFQAVTNGHINPDFTLQQYQVYRHFDLAKEL